jgi:uncharacterized protein (TIGR00369 family)
VKRIQDCLDRQAVMQSWGVTLVSAQPGHVVLEMPFRSDLTQQNGYLHAGVSTALVDSACGFAALSLMPEDCDVLSVEFKVNLLAPAQGKLFRAMGKVVKAGKTLTVCQGELGNEEGRVAVLMTATMISARPRS